MWRNAIGIYVYYDRNGIIGDYALYTLLELSKVVKELLVVVNGYIKPDEEKKLLRYDVLRRENYGNDAGAYKAAICEFYAIDKIKSCDALILMNNSVYGPIVPFAEILDSMCGRYDFWGINSFFTPKTREFIESYFICIEKDLLRSGAFKAFWNELNTEAYGLGDTVYNFEVRFTYDFEDQGYSWGVFADKNYEYSIKYAYRLYSHPYSLVKHAGVPVIKRKAFLKEYSCYCYDNELEKVIEYVADCDDTGSIIKGIQHDLGCRYQNGENIAVIFHLLLHEYDKCTNYSDVESNNVIFKNIYDSETPKEILNHKMLHNYIGIYGYEWKDNISETVKRIFWCETVILKILESIDSFKLELGEVLGICCKSGFFPCEVHSASIIGYELENYKYLLSRMKDRYQKKRIEDISCRRILTNKIEEFIAQHKRIFVYGTGKLGTVLSEELFISGINISCFIVSHDEEHKKQKYVYAIRRIDEIQFENGDGIIVAVGGKHRVDVINEIKKYASEAAMIVIT